MPFKKGDKRPDGAGRRKGTPNKGIGHKKLRDQLGDLGFSIGEEAAKLILDSKTDPMFRFAVLQWLTEWTQSKPKPVEMDEDEGGMSPEELAEAQNLLSFKPNQKGKQ